MQLCSGTGSYAGETRHEEIAISDGRDCPACEAIVARQEADEKLRDANEKIQELDEQLAERAGTLAGAGGL